MEEKCNVTCAQSLDSNVNHLKPPMEESVTEVDKDRTSNANNDKGKATEDGEKDSNSRPLVNGQRKRGRPKKEILEDNEEGLNNVVECTPKRGRGRHMDSGKVQLLQVLASQGGIAALTLGSEFTPAVVIVEPGEDLVEKVWSLGQLNGQSVCIFSATGTISKVDLSHSTGGILKCEGLYEILYVKGSHVIVETLGVCQKVAQLRMSIANAEGIVYGGLVIGSAIAAGRVQVSMAQFADIGLVVIAGTFKGNTKISSDAI